MLKRLFDVVTATTLLIALAPLTAVLAVGIRLSSPGPVLYRQWRAGRNDVPFELLKFRSMHARPAAGLETSRTDPRLFPLGRWMREFHLDELPQLWNVLVGDMSLVGPRPAPIEQARRYTARQRGRLAVRPGITGLAQVSGNNELEWNERIDVDLEYVQRSSLWLDFSILARTVGTVLRREGVYGRDGQVRDLR